MEKAIIKVEHLSHSYSVQWAIKDINFEIPRKGIYGLLGSNGAGKSTLMNILCGVIKPTSGKAYIASKEIGDDPLATKSHIGFLPQQPPVYGDLTVREYLHYAAELRDVPCGEIKKAVEYVMGLCKITHFKDRLIGNLSGGYQQRVGIAQAIIHNPDIVVLDEPANGLDPTQIIEIRNLIREVAKEHTVIFSTHILSEIKEVCDHILMIEQGKLVFNGSTEEFNLAVTPNSIFVALKDTPSISALELLEGVTRVEELGGTNFRVHFIDAQAVMDRIVRASAENRWRLSEIKLEKKSLETIFAELSARANQ